MARWKARGRLYIRYNIELFSLSLTVETLAYKRKCVEVGVFRREVGQFERRFQREGRIAQQLLLVSE